MLVTAKLLRGGRTVSDGIQFTGKIYRVSEEHHYWVGPELAVVAGPLKEFSKLGAHDVYTVELCSPPSGPALTNLPSGWLQHITIHID
jgi:hypothetical protein